MCVGVHKENNVRPQTSVSFAASIAVLAPFAIFAPAASAQEQLWLTQFGSLRLDSAGALAPDGAGGAFVGGITLGSMGGPNAGQQDVYVARYDNAGNRVWTKQFGTSGNDAVTALSSDGAGGVFVVGGTDANLGGPNAGSWDIYLARYDSGGNRLWIRQIGTFAREDAYRMVPDGMGA